MDIRILYDRPSFLVCIKPYGMISEDPGLPALLRQQENLQNIYPVHRLDQGTGGLMIFAKTAAACAFFTEAFTAQRIKKLYLAVIQSETVENAGVFEDLLFHDPKKNKSYVVKSVRKGVRKASCSWKRIGSVKEEPAPLHLVLVKLNTGRTHQIRIQFASRRMPLFGDTRYGCRIKAAHPALWSCCLSFPDPENPGRTLRFQEFPPDTDPWNRFNPDDRMCAEAFHELLQQHDESDPG